MMGLIRKAMGNYDGDELTISNKWARVTIRREENTYVVSGDAEGEYANLPDAVALALKELELYEKGHPR